MSQLIDTQNENASVINAIEKSITQASCQPLNNGTLKRFFNHRKKSANIASVVTQDCRQQLHWCPVLPWPSSWNKILDRLPDELTNESRKWHTSVLLHCCLGQLLMTSVSDDRPLQNGHDGAPCSHLAIRVTRLITLPKMSSTLLHVLHYALSNLYKAIVIIIINIWPTGTSFPGA